MYIDQDIHSLSPGVKVVFTPKDLNTIFMKVKKGTFEVRPLKGKVIKPHVNATDLVVFDNAAKANRKSPIIKSIE